MSSVQPGEMPMSLLKFAGGRIKSQGGPGPTTPIPSLLETAFSALLTSVKPGIMMAAPHPHSRHPNAVSRLLQARTHTLDIPTQL